MALSQLYKACRECKYKDTCENKRMEALGTLPPDMLNKPFEEVVNQVANNAMRETTTTIIEGSPTIVYKDEIEKEITKNLYKDFDVFRGLC